LLFASRAVTVIVEVDDPSATTLSGDATTPDCAAVAGPNTVTAEDATEAVPVPLALIALTLNVYEVFAVKPVTVQDVDVEVEADVHVPAAAAA
jgi:hypothetical protein